MNILITGANGQLGREMRIVSRDTDWHCVFTDVVEAEGVETTLLDITDLNAVRNIVREQGIQCIMNLLCRLQQCMWTRPRVTVDMKEVNGMLVYISTDYIF